jgi:hypothetical protein
MNGGDRKVYIYNLTHIFDVVQFRQLFQRNWMGTMYASGRLLCAIALVQFLRPSTLRKWVLLLYNNWVYIKINYYWYFILYDVIIFCQGYSFTHHLMLHSRNPGKSCPIIYSFAVLRIIDILFVLIMCHI